MQADAPFFSSLYGSSPPEWEVLRCLLSGLEQGAQLLRHLGGARLVKVALLDLKTRIALQELPERDSILEWPAEAAMAPGAKSGNWAERLARQLVGRLQDCLWRGPSSLYCHPCRAPAPPSPYQPQQGSAGA